MVLVTREQDNTSSGGIASPMVQAAFHLGVLFPVDAWLPGECIEIRCLDASRTPAGIGPRRFFDNHTEAVSFALAQRERFDVFSGVGWRRCPMGEPMPCRCATRGGNDHVSRLTAAYCDLDVPKCGASVDAIVDRVRSAGRIAPSIIVASGRGVHCYWTFDEPTADVARVRRLNAAIALRFGADSAIDPARVLRVAGTLHHKQAPALPVRLLYATGAA